LEVLGKQILGIYQKFLDTDVIMSLLSKITGLVTIFICLIILFGCKFPLEEEYHFDESIHDNKTTNVAPHP